MRHLRGEGGLDQPVRPVCRLRDEIRQGGPDGASVVGGLKEKLGMNAPGGAGEEVSIPSGLLGKLAGQQIGALEAAVKRVEARLVEVVQELRVTRALLERLLEQPKAPP